MNYVRSNSLSLKYQGLPPSGCQDIGINKFEFVAKTQFLYCSKIMPGKNMFNWVIFLLICSQVILNFTIFYETLKKKVSLSVQVSVP